ncbi:MAG: response regulator [Leptolyngbyaceae cyanobacterium]
MEITELTRLLELPNNNLDGYLVFTSQRLTWRLTVVQGRLLYAVDNLHTVRRWNRNLEQYSPKSSWDSKAIQPSAHRPWQLEWIDQGVNQQHLSLIRTKLMIRMVIQECLFEMSLCDRLQHEWQPSTLSVSQICRSLSLSTREANRAYSYVKDMRQQWQDAGLIGLTPTLSPVLSGAADPQRLPIPQEYVTGKYTLWDISTALDRPIVELAKLLLPLVEDNALELKSISDLPLSDVRLSARGLSSVPAAKTAAPSKLGSFSSSVISAKPAKPVSSLIQTGRPANDKSGQPLIACIDDSPVLAHSLKKILATGGYRTLIIKEPMQGFSQLIEHVPSLILLDVMLPNADGYSICRFLRDTPVFKHTPIIILTGRSKPVDRARASMAGATEFLVKPPEARELLQMIEKHLGTSEKLSS